MFDTQRAVTRRSGTSVRRRSSNAPGWAPVTRDRVIMSIAGGGTTTKTAQDAPGSIFSRGVATLVSRVVESRLPHGRRSHLNLIENFRGVEDDMDAVGVHIGHSCVAEGERRTNRRLTPTVHPIGSG